MSETSNPVSQAFAALLDAMKARAFDPSAGGSAEFGRIGKYVEVLGPLQTNWDAGLPPNGKVTGKRGRKPKADGGVEVESGSESDELSPTQTETELAPQSSGRGRRAA